MNRLRQIWSNLRSSFWFMPSMIVIVSIALAVALIEADSAGSDRWMAEWPRLFGAGAEGARGMMSTIAGSMMTVVGVTFSMVLMVLATASSQYTSRILRNFIRSRITQVVLGIFAGIFTYCLIVLRTIRNGDDGVFVPNLAVSFGFVLTLGEQVQWIAELAERSLDSSHERIRIDTRVASVRAALDAWYDLCMDDTQCYEFKANMSVEHAQSTEAPA